MKHPGPGEPRYQPASDHVGDTRDRYSPQPCLSAGAAQDRRVRALLMPTPASQLDMLPIWNLRTYLPVRWRGRAPAGVRFRTERP